jgi:cytochrome c553
MHSLPGATQQFTRAQISNQYGPADWYPGDHPTMPDIVAKGKQAQNVAACSLCHMPNGKGRPENAPVAGYPVEYFVKTMMDFKNDARKSSDSRKANTNRMIAFAKAMTDEEILQAATYFNAMPWTQWIRVVEVSTVPKTRSAPKSCVTRGQDSWRMRRWAASSAGRRSRPPVATARRSRVALVTART